MIVCPESGKKSDEPPSACNGYPSPKAPEAVETASAEDALTETNFQASNLSRDLLVALEHRDFPANAVEGAKRWCADNGAVYCSEVLENREEFVGYLVESCSLSEAEKQRVLELVENYNVALKKTLSAGGFSTSTGSLLSRTCSVNRECIRTEICRSKTTLEVHVVCDENMGGLGRTLSQVGTVEQMEKRSYYGNARPQPLPEIQETSSAQSPANQRILRKTDTVGLFSDAPEPSLRKALTDTAKKLASERLDHGQTGSVFALKTGDTCVAVFKPSSGEGFKRRGIEPNQGYIREEAVYLVDRLSGSQAGVPVTSLAKLAPDGGEEVEGSVQGFVDEVFGFVEDYGIPRDVNDAAKMLCIEKAEALALLDMRVFNMDRHGGNLLLTKKDKPHSLGPIDHGCCLPPWWCLEYAIFDAWSGWHFLQSAPSESAKQIARIAYEKLEDICTKLKEIPLDDPSILTLRLCTLFVYIGVYELDLSIGSLASKLVREDYPGGGELSWFEERVLRAAEKAGAKCVVRDFDGDKEIDVENMGADMDEEEFLSASKQIFQEDLEDNRPS